MRTFLRLALLSAALAGPAASARSASAAPPPYWILRAPADSPARRTPKGLPAAPVRILAAPRYAYGWFGAAPRRHWSRHFGYSRNFTQWSAR